MDLSDYFTPATMTIATLGADGSPHAAPVYFAAIQDKTLAPPCDWHLFYFSESKSQHSLDLANNPHAAGAIYPECHGWKEIHGVQLRGQVYQMPIGEESWETAWQVYSAKFPFVTELKAVIKRNTLYTFVPYWMRVVDNRKRFGYKKEWGGRRPG